jgi:hypothetical protein
MPDRRRRQGRLHRDDGLRVRRLRSCARQRQGGQHPVVLDEHRNGPDVKGKGVAYDAIVHPAVKCSGAGSSQTQARRPTPLRHDPRRHEPDRRADGAERSPALASSSSTAARTTTRPTPTRRGRPAVRSVLARSSKLLRQGGLGVEVPARTPRRIAQRISVGLPPLLSEPLVRRPGGR